MVDGCTKRYTDPSSLRKHLKTTHDFIEPGQYRKYLDAKKALGGEVGILEKELFKREEETRNGTQNNDQSDKMPQISLNTAMTLYNLLQTPPSNNTNTEETGANNINSTSSFQSSSNTTVQKLLQVQNNNTNLLPLQNSHNLTFQNFTQNNQLSNLLRSQSSNINLNQPSPAQFFKNASNISNPPVHNLLNFNNLTQNSSSNNFFQQNQVNTAQNSNLLPQLSNNNNIALNNSSDNSNIQNIALALTLLLNQNSVPK